MLNEQSREKNAIRNIIVGVSSQIIILLLNMFSKKVFIDQLGRDYLGINGLFTNLFLLFSFAEFGMGAAMIYSLYKPIANNDQKKIAALYQFFKKTYKRMAWIVAGVGLCLIPVLPYIINTTEPIEHIVLYYILFLTNTVIANLLIYRTYILIADQKRSDVAFYQLLFDGACFLLQIVFLLRTSNYIIYLVLIAMKTFCSNWVIGKKVKKAYPFLGMEGHLEKEEAETLRTNMKELSSYKFARVLMSGTDNIIISVMFSTAFVGLYSNYEFIIMGVLSLVTMIFSAIAASVGNLFAKESVESQYHTFLTIQNLSTWIIGVTTTCLLLLFQDFLGLYFGKDILLEMPIVIVIVLNYYLQSIRDSTKIFREAAGIFSSMKTAMWIAAIINIGLSILLGKMVGLVGIFLGTLISMLLTIVWYEPKILYKTSFQKPIKDYVWIRIRCFFMMVASVGITLFCTQIFEEITWGTFFLKAMVCFFVSNVFYIGVLFKTDAFQYLWSVVRKNFL